jgi:hypothetical protein
MSEVTSNAWYYAVNQQRIGPIAEASLRDMIAAGQVHATTLVWCESMSNWQAAAMTPAFAGMFAPVGSQPVPPPPQGQPLNAAYAPSGVSYAPPPNAATQYAPSQYQTPVDSGVSTIIPYKNGPALAGYYLAVFSLIPGIGLLLSPIAVVMGFLGLKQAKANAQAKGTAHAWTAIILGGIVLLAYIAIGIFALVAQMK